MPTTGKVANHSVMTSPVGGQDRRLPVPGIAAKDGSVSPHGSNIRSESAESGPHRRLCVFTRVPIPGATKTRLTPPLTPAQAAALQRAMTEDLLERFARVFGADDRALDRPEALSLEVRCDGDPSAGALDIPAAWTVIPQGSGDLGERLTRAVRDARRDGVGRLVIIGSDAPLLPTALVEAAFSELEARDAVLAPAEDGGYVLVAIAVERLPETALDCLFAGIPVGHRSSSASHRRGRRPRRPAVRRTGLPLGRRPSGRPAPPPGRDRHAGGGRASPPHHSCPRRHGLLSFAVPAASIDYVAMTFRIVFTAVPTLAIPVPNGEVPSPFVPKLSSNVASLGAVLDGTADPLGEARDV